MRNMLLFKKSILIVCLFFTAVISFSQVTEKWVKRENGDYILSNDAANDLVVDIKGNVYITGRSQGKGTNADYTTIKYNEDGNKKWEKRYNGTGNAADEPVAMVADSNCNVYVTGYSEGNGTGRDYATVKYDDDGNIKWVKRYNGPGNEIDQPTAIVVDRKGNVYVTGWSMGSGTDRDFATIKYDDDGHIKWIKRYNGTDNSRDQATAIAVDEGGNVYVSGYSSGIGTGRDITTIKYDKDGNIKWVRNYNGPINADDEAGALTLDDKGNVYVTGHISVFYDDNDDLYFRNLVTIKYNASGQQQWAANYDRHGESVAIAVDSSGNVFITGSTGSPDEDFDVIVTIKYNASGIQQWAATEFHGDEASVRDLKLDAAGNVYITGAMYIQGINYATIKYNTNGVQQWLALYQITGGLTEGARAIDLDNKGNVFVTGSTDHFNGDFATIKYNTSGVQKWVQLYDGPGGGGPDFANAIAVDKEGNVHVTGAMTRKNTGLDYTTFKYDTNGQREWKKTYNGPGVDEARSIKLDAKGNVYITGTSGGDYQTIKYDKEGNTRWGKRYNGPGNGDDNASAIAVDKNGYVFVTGSSVGSGTSSDFSTIKYDSNGVVKWIKRYNSPENGADRANAIALDENGNVYVTGTNGIEYVTVKYDANGNQLWVARYNGGGDDEANALALDALGNVYVTGRSHGSQGTYDYDYATIKYNSAGVQQWAARLEAGPFFASANDIAVDATGNVYIAGENDSANAAVKYNAAGVQQWVASYNVFATALALDDLGNVYITGRSYNQDNFDYATVKFNPSGVQQWEARYDGREHSDDVANDIALDAAGNVYVTGTSIGNGSKEDYVTIKYEQPPVLTKSATVPEQYNPVAAIAGSAKLNVKAFPNAFTDFINLQWSGSDKPVNITITDVTGRLVEKRTGLASSGTLKTGNNFPQGIYFAEIVQGTDKVMLKLMKQ